MQQQLQLVNAALAPIQAATPPTAKIDSHRLTFASFPILGYSLTSDNVSQTDLWELATYRLKPRLNRLDGVATVIVQGGQEPEYHIVPDAAEMLVASVTVGDLLDSVRRTNLIDSPGLLAQDHQLYLALVNGQVKTPDQIGQIVVKSTQAVIPVRIGDVSTDQRGLKPVLTVVMRHG